jgi:hypothetical protein
MRRISILTFFLSTAIRCYGQPSDSTNWTELGSSEDGTLRVFSIGTESMIDKYVIKFNQGLTWDTLSFADESAQIDSCIIKTIQVDRKGLREVMISWTLRLSHSYGGTMGGGVTTNLTRNEIWNLETRKRIFAATSNYYNWENTNSEIDSIGRYEETISICSYSYDLNVNDKGEIIVSNLKESNSNETTDYGDNGVVISKTTKSSDICLDSRPDHQVGTYKFKKGHYKLITRGEPEANHKK